MAKQQKSASSAVAKMELGEANKDLRVLKQQIKATPAGPEKKKKLEEAAKLATKIDSLRVMAKG